MLHPPQMDTSNAPTLCAPSGEGREVSNEEYQAFARPDEASRPVPSVVSAGEAVWFFVKRTDTCRLYAATLSRTQQPDGAAEHDALYPS